MRALIGERAEWLAFVNCLMDRTSFEDLLESAGPYRIRNRETSETIELSRRDYDDLAQLRLCDWLEQVARSSRWDYHPTAIHQIAHRLGSIGWVAVFGVA